MIKLKSLLLENSNIIVGIITTDDEVFSHKDAREHSEVFTKLQAATYGKRMKNRWRYNKPNKTVYWWESWDKNDGELVADHLKYKYNLDVVYQLLIDVSDDDEYQLRYKIAHGLNENNTRINTFKKELKDFIAKWRKAPEGYEKDRLMKLIKIAVAEIQKEKKKTTSEREYEFDKDEFMKHHYTGFIGSDAYSRYEQEGGLSWLGGKTKYPKLLDKGQYGPYEVEFRQSGQKNQYVQHDANGDIVRYPNGDIGYMTDDEIRKEGLPEYETSIVAFIGDKPIGFAADEFGAVGVWVEGPYQKLGIGTDLLDKHIEQRPKVKSGIGKIGQMTHKGIALTKKYYDLMAKRHGKNWFQKLKQKNG